MSNYKVIKAKKMFDGTGDKPKENIAVLISDNIIHEIVSQNDAKYPDNAIIYDLGDKTIMPGIVDAHMHFFAVPSHQLYKMFTESETYRTLRGAGEAEKMLYAGITAARCLGSSVTPSIRRAINEGHILGPRLVAAGDFIISTGGTWDDVTPKSEFADGVDGVRRKVRERVSQGVNVIKIGLSKGKIGDHNVSWGDDPYTNLLSYSLEEVSAITEEAHLNNLKVSAHCIGDESVNLAIDGNVDVIEHGYAISEATRERIVEKQIPVVTTISQLYFHEKAANPYDYSEEDKAIYQKHMEAMKESFELGLKAGVKFVLGTDLIGYPTHPQDKAAKEFELVVNWGMDPEKAIVAGTKLSAEIIGMEDTIGTIEVGKFADIIGFDGDPIADITSLQHVNFVMKNGELIKSK